MTISHESLQPMSDEILTFRAQLGELKLEYSLFKVLYEVKGGGISTSYTEEGKFWFTNSSQSTLSDIQVQLSFRHVFRGLVRGDSQPTWRFAHIKPGDTVARDLGWWGNYFQLQLSVEFVAGGIKRKSQHAQDLNDDDDHESHGQFNVVTQLYDARSEDNRVSLVEVQRFLEPELMDYFRQNPKRMYEADPIVFERLVGDLFTQKGFEVALTGRTRDGGVDFFAIDKSAEFPVKFVVQCKRYAPHRRISVDYIRELYGVTRLEEATKGVLATTSFFTKDAIELGNRLVWKLDLKDYDDLVLWLQAGQSSKEK